MKVWKEKDCEEGFFVRFDTDGEFLFEAYICHSGGERVSGGNLFYVSEVGTVTFFPSVHKYSARRAGVQLNAKGQMEHN